jgi:hypothetical protein
MLQKSELMALAVGQFQMEIARNPSGKSVTRSLF